MVITKPLNAFLKPDYSDAFDGGWEKVCSSSWSSASDDKSRERETCIDAQKGLPEVAKRNVKPIHDWHKGRLNSQALYTSANKWIILGTKEKCLCTRLFFAAKHSIPKKRRGRERGDDYVF